MRFSLPLPFVLGLVLTVHALRHNTPLAPQDVTFELKDFLITNMYAHDFSNSAASTWNRTISFLFTDLNSNTSTICSDSWSQSGTDNEAPMNYVLCDYTGNPEIFQWHFISYTNLGHFSIEFNHGWNDPKDFAPPYEYIGMFSSKNTFNLTCIQGSGYEECYQPQSQSPYHAVVNALAN